MFCFILTVALPQTFYVSYFIFYIGEGVLKVYIFCRLASLTCCLLSQLLSVAMFYLRYLESSSGSLDESDPEVATVPDPNSVLDENELFRLNEPKRSMRMYADDVKSENRSVSDR